MLTAHITTKRQAIAAIIAEADALIDQAVRHARGWDKGKFRDDDNWRISTIAQKRAHSVAVSFELSARFFR